MHDIYFSQIREDSLVEREISRYKNPRKVVVIGSGGCTAFSILDDAVQEVICVDANPAQCALIELKKTAIKHLEHPEYLAFIGETPSEERFNTYQMLIQYLPAYAVDFWEKNYEAIKVGINYSGVNERFYRFIGENICNSLYEKSVWKGLFEAGSIAEQIVFYEKFLTTLEWKIAVKILLSKTTHLQFFPSYMFANASENDFGDFFLTQFEKELKTKRLRNNYFLSQILFSSYLFDEEEGMPFYLSRAGYEITKRNIDKLTLYPESLQEVLAKEDSIDAFYLSNVFDWADSTGMEAICQGMITAKSSNAVVLYRNMLSTSSLPTFFTEQFIIDEELSNLSGQVERSMLYQKITVGRFV